MGIRTYGTMGVDWEQRIDFDRLRKQRLAKAKEQLAKSEMGALLVFDMNNVRYLTSTTIGTWAQDKISRFALLTRGEGPASEPIMWDFGSAAKHHQLHCPWIGDRSRAGISMLRGAMSPEMGRAEDVARKIKVELEMRGLHKEPLGIDVIEPPVLFALQKEGITVVDGQQVMSDARVIKTEDEISLLNHSAMMADAAYDELYRAMKPGLSENQAVGLASKVLYDLGSGVRRSRQCYFGRALQSASACLFGSRAKTRRSGLLRHPAFLYGLQDVLLPLLLDRVRVAGAGGCV